MSKVVKKGLQDEVVVPTLTYASETLVWNNRQESRLQTVEKSFLRNACSVNRMDGDSNERVYERSDMSYGGEDAKCGVVKCVKSNTFLWCDHIERMNVGAIRKE